MRRRDSPPPLSGSPWSVRRAHLGRHLDYFLRKGYRAAPRDLRIAGGLHNVKPIILGDPGDPNALIIPPLNADGTVVSTIPRFRDTVLGKRLFEFLNRGSAPVTTTSSTPAAPPSIARAAPAAPNTMNAMAAAAPAVVSDTDPTSSVGSLPATYRLDKDSPVKSMIITPQQQYTCGCCWAVSTATSLSDAFVVMGYVGRPFLLSWTDLLTCFPNCSGNAAACQQAVTVDGHPYFPSLQCAGGNFSSAAQWAQYKGLVPSACLCYSWCSTNRMCQTGAGTGGSPQSLNPLIPSCTTCSAQCTPSTSTTPPSLTNITRFYAANVVSETLPASPSATDILNHQTAVQNWIMTYGAVTATFIVLNNFAVKGTFVSPNNPSGIYLEYVGNGSTRGTQLPGVIGAHAVSVIGWSVDPVHWSLLYATQPPANSGITIDPNGFIMVPNWVVRNSWGTSWNQGGYFQIACFPYNATSQLDTPVQLNGAGSGGMMFLQAGKIDFYPDPTNNPDSPQATDFPNATVVGVNKNLVVAALTTTPAPTTTTTTTPPPPPPVTPPPVPVSDDTDTTNTDILTGPSTARRKKKRLPTYAIVLIVLGLVALILGGVYAYQQSQKTQPITPGNGPAFVEFTPLISSTPPPPVSAAPPRYSPGPFPPPRIPSGTFSPPPDTLRDLSPPGYPPGPGLAPVNTTPPSGYVYISG